jgi:O-6-methylguanine DNA methyltransferase
MSEPVIYFSRVESPVGPLLLAATEAGLRCVQFYKGKLPPPTKGEVWIESREHLCPYEEQISAYFRGELRRFTCKLDLIGTSFQKDCWEALLRIPYGETRSYAEVAREIGRPKAFRAVGQANHDNPLAIIVPCHRVLGASGTLTGYGGGLNTKEMLLRLEGAIYSSAAKASTTRAEKREEENSLPSQTAFPYKHL